MNLYQNTYDIFHRTRPRFLKFIWNHKRPRITKQEEEQQSWRNKPSTLQTIVQSYNNQNSLVLAQKQTYRSMQQNREPRNKPVHLQSINL